MWTAQRSGVYAVEAGGARGGHYKREGYVLSSGGNGATRKARFRLPADTCLKLVVGKAGGDSAHVASAAGGGGGATLVILCKSQNGGPEHEDELLLAAGGGGGASCRTPGLPGLCREAGADSAGEDPTQRGRGGQKGSPGFLDHNSVANYVRAPLYSIC